MSEVEEPTDERSTEHPDQALDLSGVSPIDREEAKLAPADAPNGITDAAPDLSRAEEPIVICDVCGPVPGP